ncbi:hypothetical protein [Deinococcus cellulosilyticus]|uniref:hypothetical protein n=1 Tax=Deinococcus cellulosilyticus TaxID=401558 RepID=UPI0011BDE759|nr:hypothetical protein [Deinococcus cellulosilyticus]
MQQGECQNLILDQGLNYILSSLNMRSICGYIAVGTSSTAPAYGQTSLGAQIAETADNLEIQDKYTLTRTANGVFTLVFFKAFDYHQANGNLTEFGAKTIGGLLITRSLFTNLGNPITITKTSDTRLLLTYTFTLVLSPVVETAANTFNIAGMGNIDSSIVFTGAQDNFGWGDADLFGCTADKGKAFNLYTSAPNMSYANSTPGSGNYGGPITYTAGTFYRDWSCEIPPTGADMTIYGYSIGEDAGANANSKSCFKVKFTSGSIVKNKDYRLTLNCRVSLTR